MNEFKKSADPLFIIRSNTDAIHEQTKTREQEALDIKFRNKMFSSSLNPSVELKKETSMVAVPDLEKCNSVSIMTYYNKIFAVFTPR